MESARVGALPEGTGTDEQGTRPFQTGRKNAIDSPNNHFFVENILLVSFFLFSKGILRFLFCTSFLSSVIAKKLILLKCFFFGIFLNWQW